MPFCPECKQSFPEDEVTCPDDRVQLVGELPFQTVDGPTSTWVEIRSVPTEDEGRLLQGFLEAEGIPSQIESLKFHMEPVNFGRMGEIRVYVAAENEAEAMRLLESRQTQYEAMDEEGETVITGEGPANIDDDSQTVVESEEQ